MDRRAAEGARRFKATHVDDGVEHRRALALARQYAARSATAARIRGALAAHARSCSDGGGSDDDDADGATFGVADGPPEADAGRRSDADSGPSQAAGAPSAPAPTRRERARARFAELLQEPDWALTVPPDLNGVGGDDGGGSDPSRGWFLRPWPAGQRVLVVAAGGRTTARDRHGRVVRVCESALPGGSPASAAARRGGGGSGEGAVLDCVLHAASGTAYVADALAWRGTALTDSPADFRVFWAASRLADLPALGGDGGGDLRFVPLPCFEADAGGVRAALSWSFAAGAAPPAPALDGVLLVLKAGLYAGGPTPLALRWRSAAAEAAALSRGAAAAAGGGGGDGTRLDDGGALSPEFVVVLAASSPGGGGGGEFTTRDGVTVRVIRDSDDAGGCDRLVDVDGDERGALVPPARSSDGPAATASPPRLMRVACTGAVGNGGDGHPALLGARVIGAAPRGRHADTWSRVAFQAALRSGTALESSDLVATAARRVAL